MNLFESFDEIVNDEFIEKFKSYSTDNYGDLKTCVDGIFYTLLLGLVRKTTSDMSAGMLFNQIKENANRVNLPSNLASIFSQDTVLKQIETNGSKIISQVFPAYKSPLLNMISTYAGTSKAKTALATNIVSNVIITIFKRELDGGKLDKDTLVATLKSQYEPLLNIIPENLLEKMIPALGLHDFIAVKPLTYKQDGLVPHKQKEIVTSKIDYTEPFKEEPKASQGWIIALIAGILVLGGALYYFYSQNGSFNFFEKQEVPVASLDSTEFENSEVPQTKEESKPKVAEDYLALKEYVTNPAEAAGKEFQLPSLKFVSDSISVAKESIAIVDSIASLMQSNPKLQIKISSMSGAGVSSFNIKRSFAVKRLLTNSGIDGIKIDAVSGGIGEDIAKIKVITK